VLRLDPSTSRKIVRHDNDMGNSQTYPNSFFTCDDTATLPEFA
jgi:hypothetical protein